MMKKRYFLVEEKNEDENFRRPRRQLFIEKIGVKVLNYSVNLNGKKKKQHSKFFNAIDSMQSAPIKIWEDNQDGIV